MGAKVAKLACDFETTTNPADVRVWAACAVEIESGKTVHLSNSLDTFMEWLSDRNTVCYFHNLKFDGEFILSWLFRNGYKFSRDRENRTFETLITDDGIVYSITVIFEKLNKKYKKVVFYDSLKKLPFPVATIAKAFDLPISKGCIDYEKERPPGYEITDEEREYIITDCAIVASALKTQFAQGLNKMTNASDALNGYKSVISKRAFETLFPVLPVELDLDLRQAYKGGWVYLNPKYKNARGLQGVTFDVNSLYPWVMRTKPLPFSFPIYFEGDPEENEDFPLFIVRLQCEFELKPGYLPTIQLKNNRRFVETEYLTDSGGDIVQMTLTSVDLKLFLEHYNVYNLEYINGWRFRASDNLFAGYIDYWMNIKETTTGALRQLAKLMLNSLYGKFATNPKARQKVPVFDEFGIVRYELDEPEERDPVYTAMGAFITAYAREKTIRSAQQNVNRFIYADTDSLHLTGHDEPETLEIHPTRLGAWKNEGLFYDSKFIRAKTYMETTADGTKVTCAGMPDNIKALVTYENFTQGQSFYGKLMPKRYPGGIVLEKTYFTIQ